MKQYSYADHVTLVGKAWEIRRHLRLMARQGGARTRPGSRTLVDYLKQRLPRER